MALRFPPTTEIPLQKAPLAEVICQVKFSPILSINKELPIDFQEAVRSRFPGLEIEQGVRFQLPSSGLLDKPMADALPRTFRFLSADKALTLALTTDFIALSTKAYTHWTDFLDSFMFAENALRQVYRPAFASRIGLRFINRFTRKNTGLSSVSTIVSLFRSDLVCMIQTDAWDEPKEMLSQMVLADDGASLNLRIGFGKEQKEPYFILDFDYFEEKQLPFNQLKERLERYHTRIYSAFRWCLKDESLAHFKPPAGD